MTSEARPRRGRPRKEAAQDSRVVGPSYWSQCGNVHFVDGWAWGTELIEKEPTPPALRCWECQPICLGQEEEILAILKGDKPIPEDMQPRRRAVLEEILEGNRNERHQTTPRASRLQRGGHTRTHGSRQKDLRLLVARAGLTRCKAHHKGKGLPRR